MKSFNFKWIVQIKAGLFMSGTHRFRTKKEAQAFVDKWNRTEGKCEISYYDLPQVRKANP